MDNNTGSKYYAIYNKIAKDYYNPLYRSGLNTDTIYEILENDVFPTQIGVNFVSVDDIFQQLVLGTHIAQVTIPNEVDIHYNEKNLAYRADMCIIGELMEFYNNDTIEFLIKNGANIEKSGNLLYWASYYGYLDIIKLIIKSCTNLTKFKDMNDLTIYENIISSQNIIQNIEPANICALIATARNHLNIIKYLMEIGFDIHFDNNYCLMLSTIYGHNDIVEYIKSTGLDINDHIDKCIYLSLNGDNKMSNIYLITKYLVTVGINKNLLHQILLSACKNGYFNVAKLIIRSGIKPTDFCLKIACENNHFSVVRLLTKYPHTKLNVGMDNNYCITQAKYHKNKQMEDYLMALI
ncbi:ankyrin repeat protein [Acanthamoeba polyphaga moumouvirus]|uniref:Ankyrin repeat protein n=1 Tax=Acanthamoeba polyphaga moumouvirus TaxID=1269028 RepID=L7RFJ1_9VIRU|nr:ankyrin repeat protein [Acanthamoeba polyphaga moumouvirus]AGC01565.1 ankyrin repeat protein [Acanthamoeba polyphaga moumouvirus]AQN67890.1 ankyrin repeat protein [Saudi moumouvirus]